MHFLFSRDVRLSPSVIHRPLDLLFVGLARRRRLSNLYLDWMQPRCVQVLSHGSDPQFLPRFSPPQFLIVPRLPSLPRFRPRAVIPLGTICFPPLIRRGPIRSCMVHVPCRWCPSRSHAPFLFLFLPQFGLSHLLRRLPICGIFPRVKLSLRDALMDPFSRSARHPFSSHGRDVYQENTSSATVSRVLFFFFLILFLSLLGRPSTTFSSSPPSCPSPCRCVQDFDKFF